ncbi:MAG: DUF423 domain-containing protein [Reichenbachiella sp.]|uniref:DUF423 domain-containing protein n=1 Tax=Reichenbachiella sp. TaxID=2184521 RepID=UPI003266179A
MAKQALLLGSIFGAISVIIGAFGAHALKDLLIANGRLEVFETAVRYQFFHTLALLVLGLVNGQVAEKWLKRAVYFFTAGIVVFSGSLYILSISNIGYFGAITPVGGVFLILGWISLVLGIDRQNKIG